MAFYAISSAVYAVKINNPNGLCTTRSFVISNLQIKFDYFPFQTNLRRGGWVL
jgi:hypothetical protein